MSEVIIAFRINNRIRAAPTISFVTTVLKFNAKPPPHKMPSPFAIGLLVAALLCATVTRAKPTHSRTEPAAGQFDHANATVSNSMTQMLCKGMSAMDHNVTGQDQQQVPYKLTVSSTAIAGGQTVNVELAGKQATERFRGFLVQARSTDSAEPIGKFVVDEDDEFVRLIDCGYAGSHNTVFQKQSRVDKEAVHFVWRAPEDFVGQVVFNATVVQTLRVYWEGLQSPVVTVRAN